MITVCIDGNYLFYKTFGIFSGFGRKTRGVFLSSEGERNMFMRKVMVDLCHSLNQIPDINQVIFCKDSRSWRKNFKISRGIYKENRKPLDGIDWDSFFKLMDEFGEYLEKKGFIFSHVPGAEGDDLLWGWTDYFKDKEDSVIILSGDKDVNQLVYSSEKKWTAVWTSNSRNNRFIVDLNWEMKDNEISVFDVTPFSGESDLKLLKLISSCTIDRINTKEFIFKKILVGDKRDDVPGVFPYKTRNGNNANLGEMNAKKIWEFYLKSKWGDLPLEEIWDDEDFLEWLSGLSLRILNQTENKENKKKFKIYYNENARLLWLNERTIPKNIVENIKKHIQEIENKERPRPIIDKKKLIKDSPWADQISPPKEFDPFNLS